MGNIKISEEKYNSMLNKSAHFLAEHCEKCKHLISRYTERARGCSENKCQCGTVYYA